VKTYTKREIRAVDLLAMILFGFGLLLVLLAVLRTYRADEAGSAVGGWIVAGVFLLLGLALNLKVRQLDRNNGTEPTQLRERGPSPAIFGSTEPRGPAPRRASPRTIVGLSLAAVAIWSFAWFGPTGIRQARWMAESRQVLPAVSERLAADGRFVGLKAFVSSGCNIVVIGNVSSEEHERELRSLMEGITFPHGIRYVVHIE